MCSVLIIIYFAVQPVVCSSLYSVKYSVLHTLKNMYLKNLGDQFKKSPCRIPQKFGHCTAHYMANCTLHGIQHT